MDLGNWDSEVLATDPSSHGWGSRLPLGPLTRSNDAAGSMNDGGSALPALFTEEVFSQAGIDVILCSPHWTIKTAGAWTKMSKRSLQSFTPANGGWKSWRYLESIEMLIAWAQLRTGECW